MLEQNEFRNISIHVFLPPLSLSLLHFFQSSPRPVKFLLSPPFNATSRIPNERTFHVLSIIADFTSHLQKSVHAQRALITGIEPFARFPRGIFPNRYCPLRFSPILHLSLSLPRPRGMRTKETKEESFHRHRRLCMRAEQTRREKRRGGTPVFCRWFRLRFETLDLGHASATTYLHNDRPREASKPEAR